jgi:hypothetical protein
VLSLIEKEFDGKISDFEEALQKVASEELACESLKGLPEKEAEQPKPTEGKTEKRQLSLSNLKAEHD